MNNPTRLEAIKKHNQLCAAVAEVTGEQQLSKEAKKQKKERTVADKKQKRVKEEKWAVASLNHNCAGVHFKSQDNKTG